MARVLGNGQRGHLVVERALELRVLDGERLGVRVHFGLVHQLVRAHEVHLLLCTHEHKLTRSLKRTRVPVAAQLQ